MVAARAGVLRAKGQPFLIEDIEVDDEPRAGEVLVRIVASGMCHTDLFIKDLYAEFLSLPVVLGHEGAGIVEKVGAQVTTLSPGDHVALTMDSCGLCGTCLSGKPTYCEESFALNYRGKRSDGTTPMRRGAEPISGFFFGQSSFSTYAIARERNAIRMPKTLPLELCGPIGCGVQTGAGTIFNVMRPTPGQGVIVFGAGAVGLSAVMAAKIAGCFPILAVDRHAHRLTLAQELGASHTVDVNVSSPLDTVKLLSKRGLAFALDTTGVPKVIAEAVECLAPLGLCVVLGAAAPGATLDLPANALVQGKTLRGTAEGDAIPQLFMPELARMFEAGLLPFDRMTKRYDLKDINRAAEDSDKTGVTVKPIIMMQ
jgi:aryl-alcohol dehydrogenase